jgi:hypothetical protein
VVSAAVAVTSPAQAIPVFAHRYGYSCQVCHTEVPHLTPFGEAFLANGYRIKGLNPKGAFPFAVRTEINYASAGAADPDEAGNGPLPKVIVNEIELLTGGSIGSRGAYWAEQYFIDGGFPGLTRDVWGAYRATPDEANVPITIRGGQFTLPLPLDPETFRETVQPYAIWSQKVGMNPFDFFDVKIGGTVSAGDPARMVSATASVLQGHDTQALPAVGADTMFTLQRDLGDFSFELYRYDGGRSFSGLAYGNTTLISNVYDRFWRNGYSVGWSRGRTEVNAVYQNGNDSSADLYGNALLSSGGFVQVRQALGDRAFAVARWDATQDTAFARILTAGLGYRLSHNTRLTLFGTHQLNYLGQPLTVVQSSLLFAY